MQFFFPKPGEAGIPAGRSLHVDTALRSIQARSRYFFTAAEFAQLLGKANKSPGVDKALQRLAKAGVIERATKRPSGWLIVPPEQAHFGAPPVTWWLDDCMKLLEPNYYVALLSAARHWGSAHYAAQIMQVMVAKPKPPLTPGRLTVEFFSKRSLEQTPTTVVSTGVAPWRVSTREATLFDLVRHQVAIGGLENVARIAKDLGRGLTGDGVTKAAEAMGQVPVAQRLGFIFARLKLKHPMNRLEEWLTYHRTVPQPLALGGIAEHEPKLFDRQWSIWYTLGQQSTLEELA